MNNLGDRIIKCRAKNNLSQVAFSRLCGVGRKVIINLETADAIGIRTANRIKIEAVLDEYDKQEEEKSRTFQNKLIQLTDYEYENGVKHDSLYSLNELRLQEQKQLEFIKQHPDFKICGVPVSDMFYDEKTKLFTVSKVLCRITVDRLYAACCDCKYKKKLENSIKIGK